MAGADIKDGLHNVCVRPLHVKASLRWRSNPKMTLINVKARRRSHRASRDRRLPPKSHIRPRRQQQSLGWTPQGPRPRRKRAHATADMPCETDRLGFYPSSVLPPLIDQANERFSVDRVTWAAEPSPQARILVRASVADGESGFAVPAPHRRHNDSSL